MILFVFEGKTYAITLDGVESCPSTDDNGLIAKYARYDDSREEFLLRRFDANHRKLGHGSFHWPGSVDSWTTDW